MGAGEFDGGGIIVDLVGLHLEDLDGLEDQAGEQTGAIGRKEPVQSSSQSVVAQMLRGTPERIATLRPGLGCDRGRWVGAERFWPAGPARPPPADAGFAAPDVVSSPKLGGSARPRAERPEFFCARTGI